MRLENVTISNFRSFGPVPIATAIANEITAIVGPNVTRGRRHYLNPCRNSSGFAGATKRAAIALSR